MSTFLIENIIFCESWCLYAMSLPFSLWSNWCLYYTWVTHLQLLLRKTACPLLFLHTPLLRHVVCSCALVSVCSISPARSARWLPSSPHQPAAVISRASVFLDVFPGRAVLQYALPHCLGSGGDPGTQIWQSLWMKASASALTHCK